MALHGRLLPLILGLLGVFTLAACDESVDAILESDRNYTLFGTLDMSRDTQFVRVERIRDVLQPDSLAPLDVTFTSTDQMTGRTVVWRDSMLTFSNGTTGHVFYAPLRLESGHTYRIQIDDPGERVPTWAETTVPQLVNAEVRPESVTGNGGGTVGRGTQEVLWQSLDRRPFQVETWYRFIVSERTPFVDVVLPYEAQNEAVGAEDWLVRLDLRKDRLALDTLFQVRTYPLVGVGLRITVLDEAFVPPGGVFDPDVLVQPGTLSNVENGFGFVGSVARFSAEWVLSDASLAALGYVTLTDHFGKRAEAALHAVIRLSDQKDASDPPW